MELLEVEIAKAGPAAAGKELASIVSGPAKDVVGPPAKVFGQYLRLKLEALLTPGMLDAQARIDREYTERGILHPKDVAPKVALPLIEALALEDNPDLAKMFTDLAVNALDPNCKHDVIARHVATLKLLTPDEALVLRELYAHFTRWQPKNGKHRIDQEQLVAICKLPEVRGLTAIQILLFNGLIEERALKDEFAVPVIGMEGVLEPADSYYSEEIESGKLEPVSLSFGGNDLMKACIKPERVPAKH